jgi:hypothetical protein
MRGTCSHCGREHSDVDPVYHTAVCLCGDLGGLRLRPMRIEQEAPVCSNCQQWQHDGDCVNECVKRGFV